jgi:hypothetical protein
MTIYQRLRVWAKEVQVQDGSSYALLQMEGGMCTRAMIMSAQGPMAPDSPDWAYPSRHRFPPERKKGKGASNSLLSLAILLARHA